MSEQLQRETLLGLRIVTSTYLPGPHWHVYADWRERLRRNLSRLSTGRWEALDDGFNESVYIFPDDPSTVFMRPETFAVIKLDALR